MPHPQPFHDAEVSAGKEEEEEEVMLYMVLHEHFFVGCGRVSSTPQCVLLTS